MPSLTITALSIAVVGLVYFAGSFITLGRARVGGFLVRCLLGLVLMATGALLAAIAVGIQGYQALTREEVAALISVKPSGPQRFDAKFRFADGREASFVLAGDELYVDAHILKWKSVANFLGLHTAYELDRVAGRYRAVEQEKNGLRTVFPLREPPLVDLFDLRSRYTALAPLLDAEYGSASFVKVDRPAELELRVSPTGLLIREVAAK